MSFGATFTQDGGESEHRVIVDADTGELLAVENIWSGRLGPPGSETVDGMVENYFTVVETGYTDALPPCADTGCTKPGPGPG